MLKEYKIYKLVLDGEVVYVGQTTKKYLSNRKNGHHSDKTFERVKESKIELIEITTDITREIYWIEYYLNEGCELFNKQKGATGLCKEEYIKKWKQENKDKHKNYQKEYQKEYDKKNKEKRREQQRIRRAKKKLENNNIN